MKETKKLIKNWGDYSIGITGANGSLGRSLTKELREKGSNVIGFTHSKVSNPINHGPNTWVQWRCGEEDSLNEVLSKVNILIINHGVNLKGQQTAKAINDSIEINALSSWRLIWNFEKISRQKPLSHPREIWVNTSEAEIQPALSPTYEISKRLIGQIVSMRWNDLEKDETSSLIIRKLVLGPFRSNLNPIGIMSSDNVAKEVIKKAERNIRLIIVTPNPFTYIFMPITELKRNFYSNAVKGLNY